MLSFVESAKTFIKVLDHFPKNSTLESLALFTHYSLCAVVACPSIGNNLS